MSELENEKKIVTRFSPSPTGFLHIGGIRTALFSYLFAKQKSGKYILRIEDTDKERSKEEWTEQLINDLKWLKLDFDEFAKQSDRVEIHKQYLKKMIADGSAYISKEVPTEPNQREEVIRFKNPNKKIIFEDMIRGQVQVDTTDLGDFILARSLDEPLYHLAVVVDDFEMGVTHVIRAEEHLSNTPRQILIQEAIGAYRPFYAHLPLVLAEDRSKLSKRKHGEKVSLTYYRNRGYLPEAIINLVALIGWNPGNDQEILSIDELISNFNLEKVQKGGGIFNVEKLNWINKEYLKKIPREDLKEEIKKYLPDSIKEKISEDLFEKIFPLIFDRISCYGDIPIIFETGEFDYFLDKPNLEKNKIAWKDDKDLKNVQENLTRVKSIIESLDLNNFSEEKIKEAIWDFATEKGRGSVLWPLRYCLTGKDKSPDPFVVASILGKNETLDRLNSAIEFLN